MKLKHVGQNYIVVSFGVLWLLMSVYQAISRDPVLSLERDTALEFLEREREKLPHR